MLPRVFRGKMPIVLAVPPGRYACRGSNAILGCASLAANAGKPGTLRIVYPTGRQCKLEKGPGGPTTQHPIQKCLPTYRVILRAGS